METFAEVVRRRVGDDHEGLRFEGRSWTWDEVVRESCVRASLLRTVEPGEGRTQRHVGILLQNVPDFVFWILGAALNGDAVVGINPTRRGAELAHDVRHADCDLLLTEPMYADSIDGLDLGIPADRVLDIESAAYARLLEEHAGAELPAGLPDPASILLLLFSSGSTGAPKAVICSQGRLGRLTESMAERIAVRRGSVNYLCLPLFHGHAIMMTLATAAEVGATVVMVRRFSASRFISDIREHRITFFNYVGRVLSYILSQPEQESDRDNSLEVVFGSEASPAEVRAFRERFACPDVREGYGASEGVIRITPVPGSPDNSLGLPAAGVVAEIRDPETGEECPRAVFDDAGVLLNAEQATGEIVAIGRGASFEGYYRNPGAMADRLKLGGEHFWTGDLGYRDEAGYFYFGGRPADWLRVDGENFGAAPVERILVRFPAFAGAHAFGVPDPKTGDLLMAVVTLKDGHDFDPERFSAFLAEQPDLGAKWRPTFVRVVDAVPTTANGKIDKAPLRVAAWEANDVWFAPTRTSPYARLTDEQRTDIRATFIAAGRENALPAGSRALLAAAGER
ncbi:MAG TPA: AMP-binding protein [Nocardioides sp.]|uniref:AMP-binding protein n=1 Tax=Nocardioides sp. TaxID=35761 RepID=UPI002B82672F|nr:AMP-binding protein [Nocardioides sp.]HTW15352.1 AMP-binding protein [Nocardioides sp.]